MKEIIDKHFNAISLMVALTAIIGTFYATNQSVNARIDTFHQDLKEFRGNQSKLEERFINYLENKHKKI